ncbi:hypothetical protein AGABI1DRAFT_122096 [Agaricus bisporus var. burnettii JB137-S8]|uniref:Uncharacterized protein n=1 Tax=Agaricus bisporus var. burnettii (strain JB137-S8 / ATCC MYA-4627 / FGSC 10392) TaxID=597362 RepID=K5WPR3_AGABU|nr:hypothetical protein AGABI2DRAFT_194230 [Agaricus bisporus var. bisporus H97]XP_007331991.1 uncharacterized protein AGABI1DRAFT_122096 [Agaricus bisporus var. burnettii JB137-S8]EKM77346.1 hypothetical protein AGABI1DRAFT_122096 [Agaricus bisporus var. burnettii JB137-S8]EKV45251.1 hypothetical protein AGABI2DRAFT_194230 [Agaricus bisporus var. bisporus H97]
MVDMQLDACAVPHYVHSRPCPEVTFWPGAKPLTREPVTSSLSAQSKFQLATIYLSRDWK